MIIRKPAVAGQFYPEDKNKLKGMINDFLNKAVAKEKNPPLVLIVPHAGLVFSGSTAGVGFKQIKDKGIKKVFLLGVSHTSFFPGIAVDDSDYWETPLGKVKINPKLVEKIIGGEIYVNQQAHLSEHSLEVEIPFLQIVLDNFGILPILIGQLGHEKTGLDLVKKISKIFDQQSLLIVSSDLSHYPDYQTAKIVDNKTIKAILSGQTDFLKEAIKQLSFDFPEVDTFACGQEAIKIGMLVAKDLGAEKIKLLSKTNSGEISADKDRVVGYASIGFYK